MIISHIIEIKSMIIVLIITSCSIILLNIYTSSPRIINQKIESFLQEGDASMVVLIEDVNGMRVVEYIPPDFAVRPN